MYQKFKVLSMVMLLSTTISLDVFSNEIQEITTLEDYSNNILDQNLKKEESKLENVEIKEVKKIIEDREIKDEVKIEEIKKLEKVKEIVTKELTKKEKKEAVRKALPIFSKSKIENVSKKIKNEKTETNKKNEIKAQTKSLDIYKKEPLALEEPENPNEDKKEVTRTKYHHNGVEWELPDNFRSVLIGDLKGNIIFSKDANIKYPLASVTKIMTLLVTFDEINAGNISLTDEVTISKNPLRYGGSGIPLKAGQVFTLEDLIKASAIYSANNATYAIAEYVGKGSVSNFVKKMNAKLDSLGLSNEISYYTPAGLPTRVTKQPMDEGTAKGIYKLSIEALKYKKYLEIAGITSTTIHNGKIKIRNRNHLLGEEGIYGIKTGYHKEAKYNISVASKVNGKDVIIVVMGGETYKARDGVVLEVLDTYKKNYLNR